MVSSCGGFHLHTSKKYKIEEEEERPSKLKKKKQQKTTKAEEMTRKPATKWRIIRRLGKATDIFNKEP